MNNKTKKNIIIGMMLCFLAIMTIAYAAFAANLNISGTGAISSTWDIRFTNIEQKSETGGVTVVSPPTASGTTATFDVDLTSPGDKIVYEITLSNLGTLNALISNIVVSDTGNEAISFDVTGIAIGDKVEKATTKRITVTIEYEDVSSQPSGNTNELEVNIVTVQDLGQEIGGTYSFYDNGEIIYFNPETGLKCDDYVVGNSDTENKTGCMKWYAFNDTSLSTLNLILDHNTTEGIAWNSSGDNSGGPVTVNAQLVTDTSTWNVSARLITANEIARITEHPTFDSTLPFQTLFYFDTNTTTQSSTCKSFPAVSSGCQYGWLYDRISPICQSFGCLNNAVAYTPYSYQGYWTSSPDAIYSNNAWYITAGSAGMSSASINGSTDRGVRPVITVSKSVLE